MSRKSTENGNSDVSGTCTDTSQNVTLRELRRAEAAIVTWGASKKEEVLVALERIQRLAAYWRALMYSYYTHQPNLWRKDQPPPIYVSQFSPGGVCLSYLRKNACVSWSHQNHEEVASKLNVIVPTIDEVLDPENRHAVLDRQRAGKRLAKFGTEYLRIAREVGSLELTLRLWDNPNLRR